jgi:hypothetical protein
MGFESTFACKLLMPIGLAAEGGSRFRTPAKLMMLGVSHAKRPPRQRLRSCRHVGSDSFQESEDGLPPYTGGNTEPSIAVIRLWRTIYLASVCTLAPRPGLAHHLYEAALRQMRERQFCDAVNRIVLPEPFVKWATDALRLANTDDACLREEAVSRLTAEHKCIEKRLDVMSKDKLDGIITAEMFDRHAGQWTLQMDQLDRSIQHQQEGSDRNYLPEGGQLLELIKIMPMLFERQPPREKRELLKLVISNSTWKDGTLTVSYRQPFDLFTTWRETMNKESALNGMKNGQNEEWLLR